MLDNIDKAVLQVAYFRIERNPAKLVSGSEIWRDLSIFSPPLVPARLRRLVTHGLLEKDKGNSSSRTKVYAPTDAGYSMVHQMKLEGIAIT